MFDLDFWQEVWTTITRNKVRSLLTAFGVFWGIYMLVVMAGSATGIKNSLKQDMGQLSANSAFFFTKQTTEPYKGFSRGRFVNFDMDDLDAVERDIPRLKYATAVIWGSGGDDNVKYKDKKGTFGVKGYSPDFNKVNPTKIEAGRYLNDIDVLQKRKVCVIGVKIKNDLYGTNEDCVGSLLSVNGVYYTVIGVSSSISENNIFGDPEETVCVPYTTMQQTQNLGKKVHALAFTAYDDVDMGVIEQDIVLLLKKRHVISPTDAGGVSSFNTKKMFDMFRLLFMGLDILVWIVGMGTLFSGMVGVSNIMLVTVKERTQEIGVRRALGASPWLILRQIMSEGLVLSVISGFIGLALGVGTLNLIDWYVKSMPDDDAMLLNPQISFSLAVAASIVLIISGIIAGWLPSNRALKIKAIDALRDE